MGEVEMGSRWAARRHLQGRMTDATISMTVLESGSDVKFRLFAKTWEENRCVTIDLPY